MPLFLSGCWRSASRALPGREGKEIIAPRARKNASQKLTAFFIRVLLGRGSEYRKRRYPARSGTLACPWEMITAQYLEVSAGNRERVPPSFLLSREVPPFSAPAPPSPAPLLRAKKIPVPIRPVSSVLPVFRASRHPPPVWCSPFSPSGQKNPPSGNRRGKGSEVMRAYSCVSSLATAEPHQGQNFMAAEGRGLPHSGLEHTVGQGPSSTMSSPSRTGIILRVAW